MINTKLEIIYVYSKTDGDPESCISFIKDFKTEECSYKVDDEFWLNDTKSKVFRVDVLNNNNQHVFACAVTIIDWAFYCNMIKIFINDGWEIKDTNHYYNIKEK